MSLKPRAAEWERFAVEVEQPEGCEYLFDIQLLESTPDMALVYIDLDWRKPVVLPTPGYDLGDTASLTFEGGLAVKFSGIPNTFIDRLGARHLRRTYAMMPFYALSGCYVAFWTWENMSQCETLWLAEGVLVSAAVRSSEESEA